VLALPQHLDVFENGIASRLDFSFSGPQGARLARMVAAGQIQIAPAAALVAGAVPFTYLGTHLGRRISPRFLRILLGLMLALIALRGVVVLVREHLA